jgi:hypothetical protein
MRPIGILLSVVLGAATFAHSQSSSPSESGQGAITGVVIDAQGQPVAKAMVCRLMRRDNGSTGSCLGRTDANGAFKMRELPLMTYELSAMKEQGCHGRFSPEQSGQSVTLTPEQPSTNVIVKLGKQESMVKLHATNKFTGEPVTTLMAQWAIEDPAHGTRQEGGSGTVEPPFSEGGSAALSRWSPHICVPPNLGIRVEVSANGYHTWLYTDPENPSRPQVIRLQPGEEQTLEVQLEPWTDADRTK